MEVSMDLIKLTGLWKKEGQKGAFYSGRFGLGGVLLVFKNDRKDKETDPDLVAYVGQAEKREKPTAEGQDTGVDIPF